VLKVPHTLTVGKLTFSGEFPGNHPDSTKCMALWFYIKNVVVPITSVRVPSGCYKLKKHLGGIVLEEEQIRALLVKMPFKSFWYF